MTALAATLKNLPVLRIDRAWIASAVILALLAVLDAGQFLPSLNFAANALLSTAPYMVFAVLCIAFLKASGADAVIARAFQGREVLC